MATRYRFGDNEYPVRVGNVYEKLTIRAEIVYESWHYKYSSVANYCTEMNGMLDLELV